MDFIMIGILTACYLSVKLFAGWCGRLVEKS